MYMYADVFPMHLGQTHVAYVSHMSDMWSTLSTSHVEHMHPTYVQDTCMIHTCMYVGGKCVLLKDSKCIGGSHKIS